MPNTDVSICSFPDYDQGRFENFGFHKVLHTPPTTFFENSVSHNQVALALASHRSSYVGLQSQRPLYIHRPSSMQKSVSYIPSKGCMIPLRMITFCHYIQMTIKHYRRSMSFPWNHAHDIAYFVHSHLFKAKNLHFFPQPFSNISFITRKRRDLDQV